MILAFLTRRLFMTRNIHWAAYRYLALLLTISVLTGCASIVAEQLVKPPNASMGLQGPTGERSWYPDVDDNIMFDHRFDIAGSDHVLIATQLSPLPVPIEWIARMEPIDGDGDNNGFEASLSFSTEYDPHEMAADSQVSRGTVVLLHGYAGSRMLMYIWAGVLAEAGYTALMVDLPGHGESPTDFITYGVREADAVNALQGQLEARNLPQPYSLLGISLGGTIALRAALQQPAWKSVVAFEPFNTVVDVIPNVIEDAPWYARLFAPRRVLPKAFVKAERIAGFKFADTEIVPLLDQLRVPSLVLHSADDEWIPVEQSRAIKAAAPEMIDLRVYPEGGDHIMFPLQLWRHCKPVLSWLAQVNDNDGDIRDAAACNNLIDAVETAGFPTGEFLAH